MQVLFTTIYPTPSTMSYINKACYNFLSSNRHVYIELPAMENRAIEKKQNISNIHQEKNLDRLA